LFVFDINDLSMHIFFHIYVPLIRIASPSCNDISCWHVYWWEATWST